MIDPLTSLDAARFGIYVHFPYCLSKCPYCDFASIVSKQVPEARYADAIARELELRIAAAPGVTDRLAESIYFGGGTPSLWDPSHVRRVLELLRARLKIAPGAEVTLEANPGAADAERFAGYRAAGINRLSIGVQSFQLSTLKFLGRAHDAAMAERAFQAARTAGFDNVSLDFIYGVPGQSVDEVRRDAERASGLGADHLSAYALTLDRESLAEEVPLAKQLARKEVELPPDEAVLQMQRTVRDVYRQSGLERYEISNYAKPGRHSRHNAAYWTGGEYLALGTGATGFLRDPPGPGVDEEGKGGARYSNHRSAERYLAAVEQGALPSSNVEALTAHELFEERVAMGLRLSVGIDLDATCREYGQDAAARAKVVDALIANNLAWRSGNRLALTDEGADVHSAISAKLM